MIHLAMGDWAATVLDGQGAALRSLTWRGRDVVEPVPTGESPNLGLHSAFLMAPWTNRLDRGRIEVGGTVYHMPINRPLEGNALHGFVRDQAWTVESQAPDRATMSCTIDHAPFRCTARMQVTLSHAGLELSFALTNTGDIATPMGFGWHPFFYRPPETRLSFRAETVFGRGPTNLAVAPRAGTGLVGGDAVLLGLDAHFAGWDGVAEITRPDGLNLVLRANGAWAGNVHVYAPAQGHVLCVEPVTHAPDAVNNPVAAAHGPMRPLAPGATMTGALTLFA